MGQPAPRGLRDVPQRRLRAVGDRLRSEGGHQRALVRPGRADQDPAGAQAGERGGHGQAHGAGADDHHHPVRRAAAGCEGSLGGVGADRQGIGEHARPGLQPVRQPVQLGGVGDHPASHPPGQAPDVPGVDAGAGDARDGLALVSAERRETGGDPGQGGIPRAAQPSQGLTTTVSPTRSSIPAGSTTRATISWPMTWGKETRPESGLSQSAWSVASVTSLPHTPVKIGSRVTHSGPGGAGSGSLRGAERPGPRRAHSGSSELTPPATASRAGRGSKTRPSIGASPGSRSLHVRERYAERLGGWWRRRSRYALTAWGAIGGSSPGAV